VDSILFIHRKIDTTVIHSHYCGQPKTTTVVFCPLLWILKPLAVDICCVHLLWIFCCHYCDQPKTTTLVFCPLLWVYVATTCCRYILHPFAVDILLPLLWSAQIHHCGILCTCCGHMLHPLAVDLRCTHLLWINAAPTCCGDRDESIMPA